jgi:hypothetical protein
MFGANIEEQLTSYDISALLTVGLYYNVTKLRYSMHPSYLWTYDLYGPVRNAFDGGKSITMASGRGWTFWAL